MKSKYILSLALVLLLAVSLVKSQACDIYVDNNTSCPVDIQFRLYDFNTTTNCDDGLNCGNGHTYETGWITIPASSTGYLAVAGSALPLGGWGRATIADANGDGDEEYDGDCGSSTWNTTECGVVNIGVPTHEDFYRSHGCN